MLAVLMLVITELGKRRNVGYEGRRAAQRLTARKVGLIVQESQGIAHSRKDAARGTRNAQLIQRHAGLHNVHDEEAMLREKADPPRRVSREFGKRVRDEVVKDSLPTDRGNGLGGHPLFQEIRGPIVDLDAEAVVAL